MRTDHLSAVIKYALEQATTSDINPLAWDDNENAIGELDAGGMQWNEERMTDEQFAYRKQEIIEALESMLIDVNAIKGQHHKTISLVDANPTDVLPQLLNLWQGLYNDPAAPNAWGELTYELLFDENLPDDDQPMATKVSDVAETLANDFSHELITRLELADNLRQAYVTKD